MDRTALSIFDDGVRRKQRRGAMRTAFLIFSIPVFLISLTACQQDQDDYFPQTASQRLQNTISHASQVLRSAEHGWELEYYPGGTFDYGGIVYTVRFDSLTATVGCSLIPDSTETSYYRLTNDNGPVLTFDTYNALLHYYSTPSSQEYQAKGGEFEFVIDSIADDYISLYGKKTGNSMCLRRLSASPDEYAEKTIAIFDSFVDSIRGTIGGADIAAKVNPTNRSLGIVSGRDTLSMPFTFTDRGIRLYRPLRIGGTSVQTFSFDADSQQLTCTDDGADGVVLQGTPYADDVMSYSKYEADYNLIYQGGTVQVKLVPNRMEGTYLLQGLNSHYNLVLHYDPRTGNLTLGSQIVGESNGRTLYWVCYDYNSGSLSLDDEGQFTISWNKNRFYPMFNFTATNPRVLNCNGGLLISIYTDTGGTLTAAVADDAVWMTNGSAQFAALRSLNRRTRM